MDIVLINPPVVTPFAPYLAAPSVQAELLSRGHRVFYFDLAASCWADWEHRQNLVPTQEHETPEQYIARMGNWVTKARKLSRSITTEQEFFPYAPDSPYTSKATMMRVVGQCDNHLFAQSIAVDIPEILSLEPSFVLFSVSFSAQLRWALYIKHLLQERGCKARFVFGGARIRSLSDGPLACSGWEPVLPRDEVFTGDIEYWFPNDPSVTERNAPISDKTPCFRRYDSLDKWNLGYCASIPTLPLLTWRGCFWKKCTFCGTQKNRGGCTALPVSMARDMMGKLHQDYGVSAFTLNDEGPSVKHLTGLARELQLVGSPYSVLVNSRVDPTLLRPGVLKDLRAGGIKMLQFGVESANARTLKNMRKGIHVALVKEVIAACHEAKILTQVYFILGFPGETPKEARHTMDVVRDLKPAVARMCQFGLEYNSPLYASDKLRDELKVEVLHEPELSHYAVIHRSAEIREAIGEWKEQEQWDPLLHGGWWTKPFDEIYPVFRAGAI